MSYAIIGSGAIGGALAKQFVRSKVSAVITNRRGPASLEQQAFAPTVSPAETADALDAEVIILAVPFEATAEVAKLHLAWPQCHHPGSPGRRRFAAAVRWPAGGA